MIETLEMVERVAQVLFLASWESSEHEWSRRNEGQRAPYMRVARTAIAEMLKWCPIETAPTTGKWMLVWNGNLMCVGAYYGGKWCYVGGQEPQPMLDPPTHWMESPRMPLCEPVP